MSDLAPSAATAETETDEEIVRRVLDGDTAAFERLLRRYNQRLFRVARGIVGDDGDAEDVVQEAYLKAYEHLGEFAGRSSFATWLTRIAVHEATARRRRGRRVRVVDVHEAEALAMAPSNSREPHDEANTRELGDVLRHVVDELPADFRVVFTLRLVEGLSTEDTAECLGLSPENVKVRLHRARSRLRGAIERRLGAEVSRLYQFDGERCDRIVRKVMSRLPSRGGAAEPR
jgi:RNA polymerase sigma-70 factor (ECF subfamily)